jgi:transcription antitermination factor NusG
MDKRKWYAVYVRSRNEKKVYANLLENNFESYLPLLKTLKQWKDRKKLVDIPLFNSYVFVYVDLLEQCKVRQVQGIVNFVCFEGKPTLIPDDQIKSLKLLLQSTEKFEMGYERIEPGDEVEVNKGALKGFRGTLTEYKGKKKVLLRIDVLNQYLMVEIQHSFLKKLNLN